MQLLFFWIYIFTSVVYMSVNRLSNKMFMMASYKWKSIDRTLSITTLIVVIPTSNNIWKIALFFINTGGYWWYWCIYVFFHAHLQLIWRHVSVKSQICSSWIHLRQKLLVYAISTITTEVGSGYKSARLMPGLHRVTRDYTWLCWVHGLYTPNSQI